MLPGRHSGTFAAALLGAGLFLSGCDRSPAPPPPAAPVAPAAPEIPDVRRLRVPNSPDGQIAMISFRPAARCVLDVNDHLEIQFRSSVPEAPCQVFARLELPDNYAEFAAHGFTMGSAACPSLLSGHGILKQGFSLFYDPKRDQHGADDTNFPPLFRATNVTFIVYSGAMAGDEDQPLYFIREDGSHRTVYSAPVDVTWVCKKTPILEARRAQEIAEWNQVLELYPDAVLPDLPPKKSRAKKPAPEKPPAEP